MDIAINLQNQEQNLIIACIKQERWAQKRLYEEHYSKMMGICMRYSNNREDAKDILHEGFIKVYKNLKKYKPGTSLNAWIKRIMVNTAIDFYRKSTRRRTENIENAQLKLSSDVDAVSQCAEREILSAVQQLSPVYRTVFNMYVIEGYPHKEIAKHLGITESTSRSNLLKARMKLQQLLATKYSEYEQ